MKFEFNDVIYLNEKHKENFNMCCKLHKETGRDLDEEVIPVFYLLSLAAEIDFDVIHGAYNFKDRVIKPQCLEAPWQTSSMLKTVRLAFNLWNGFMQEGREVFSTPYEIFENSWAPYFVQAIKLRYHAIFRKSPEEYLSDLMRNATTNKKIKIQEEII